MATRMLQRRGTAAEWAAANPVLSEGEIGFETDTNVMLVGDGVTPWNSIKNPNAPINSAPPIGAVLMFSGSIASLPPSWKLCDGTNGTPDLRDKFVVGAGSYYSQGDKGGSSYVNLQETHMPSHTHDAPAHKHSGPSHSHDLGTSVTVGSNGSHAHANITRRAVPTQTHAHNFNNTGVSSPPDGWVESDNFNTGLAGTHNHSMSGRTNVGGTGETGWGGSASTGTAGSGSAHENRPPYYALAYIMRVA